MKKFITLLLFFGFIELGAVDIGEILNKITPALQDINNISTKISPVIVEVQKQAPIIRNEIEAIASKVQATQNEKLTSNKIKNIGMIVNNFAELTLQLNTLITKLDDVIKPISTLVKIFDNNTGQQIDQADIVIDQIRDEMKKIPEIARQISELTQTISGVIALGEQFSN